MTLRALRYSATAAVVVLLGCRDPFALSDGTFHGHYDTGLASIVFTPCGADESWHVLDAEQRVAAVWPQVPLDWVGTFYVRWRGHLSDEGHYGALGLETRQLRVTEVVEVRPATIDDCP